MIRRLRAALRRKHECSWDVDELARLKTEVRASLKRRRRERAAARRRLPRGWGSQW